MSTLDKEKDETMTSKDYERIALVIRESGQFATVSDQARFAHEMATELADDNPRFSRTRFIEACEPRWLPGTLKHDNWTRTLQRISEASL